MVSACRGTETTIPGLEEAIRLEILSGEGHGEKPGGGEVSGTESEIEENKIAIIENTLQAGENGICRQGTPVY